MRRGENPIKNKGRKVFLKKHRVIMVFYVPDYSENIFFENLESVLDKSLDSLIKTVNHDVTNITLINNASSRKTDLIVEKNKKYIDKYVYYNTNKGKVNAVLSEARSVYEEFVTITDADILFYSGWESETFKLFKNFKNVGAVSPYPCPYLTFYCNKSSFGYNSLFNKIEYGKFVKDYDIDLYLKGTNLPNLIKRNARFNWKEKQFVLNENNIKAVIGSYHVVGTYRSFIFKNETAYPEYVFKNSYEESFIDYLADKKGLNKLSTLKSYIYHIGNHIDNVVHEHEYNHSKIIKKEFFNDIVPLARKNKVNIYLNRALGYLYYKYKWKKK
jgi:hypothetical protein